MPRLARLAVLLAAALLVAAPLPAPVQAAGPQPVAILPGVTATPIASWDRDRLNRILTTEAPAFLGLPVTFTPATSGVTLYRITYPSVVPEQGNRPITATGLLAIPDTGASRYPMVSYQHGTVYLKSEVPSQPENSTETRIMIAQFAGQGHVVIGADYFGMGTSSEPEGYMVKASHQQATFDMLMASRAVLAEMKIDTPDLFLAGWSQGGFVTMAFLEKLEAAGVPVRAAATASAPVDVGVALRGFLDFPRPEDATWVTSLFILSSFAFENYYGVPGLARALITDEYYEIAKKAYERQPYDMKDIPTDIRKLIRPEFFDPQVFAASAYGRLAMDTTAYRWIVQTPVRNYYGTADEVISVGLGRLAMTYQQAIGAGNPKVEAVPTGPTTHRGTFGTAVPLWKAWFDGL